MPAPTNTLKEALQSGRMQIGLWLGFGHPTIAEIAAGAGFDFCLIDAEHGPNDIPRIQMQLQAMNGRGAAPVVRVPIGEDWVLKQVLDLGAQSILVPMIGTPEQAANVVAATRYAPEGRRGLGAALARASDYNGIPDYARTANGQICVMVQAESAEAIENIDDIATTEGVDVVFIGPADLSADMGHLGEPDHPDVVAAIEHAVARTLKAGKAAGIITFDTSRLAYYRDLGVTFLAAGGDVTTFSASIRTLAAVARQTLENSD